MVSNVTFNNISVILWRSVLLVEETEGPGESHRPAGSHWQILSHNVVHIALSGSRTHNITNIAHATTEMKIFIFVLILSISLISMTCDRIEVGFTTTFAIGAHYQ
jgi:hypothetical protein